MAPTLLFDLDHVDMDQVALDAEQIEQLNPHRGAMRMLDSIIWIEDATLRAVAYRDIRDDEFWVAGHIPGRPIFPGVLMIEAGAQLASLVTMRQFTDVEFLGFIGCDQVKFRGQVVPGDRLIMIGEGIQLKRRRSICAVQGLVNGNLVFEGRITGMPI